MTSFRTFFAAIAAFSIAACSQAPAQPPSVTGSEWTLDSDGSSLTYVSIKADSIGEANSFEKMTGGISADGAATIEIDLASVSTGVDIRDERMRDVFFVVTDYPTATVTAQLDPAEFDALAVSEPVETRIDGTVSLKGVEAPFLAFVTVTRMDADRVSVYSSSPTFIDAGRYELTDELARLQELAGLPSISPVVPVTFSLIFER